MNRTTAAFVLHAVLAACVGSGCKVEPVQDPNDLAVRALPARLASLPQVPERGAEVDPILDWETSVRKHLSFLTSSDLTGRRPGTQGGRITAAAAETLFGEADLVPSAGNFGWTTAVPVRVVRAKDVKISFFDPADPSAAQTVLETGLWVHHRGEAGSFSLPLKPVRLSSGAPPTGTLALARLEEARPGEPVVEPSRRVRAVLDAALHRGAAACLLEIPDLSDAALRTVAEGWAEPEVQSIDLDRDPPSGLAFEGFLAPAAFEALVRVSAAPDASVMVNFEAEERWFEDNTVVGRVVGRSRPEQVVIVTANWDAGGLAAEAPAGGAALEASGPAALFALVERTGLLLGTGRRPERSIVFVAAAAGSLGNLGLARIADAGIAIPENIVAIIHLDALDWSAPTQTILGGTESTLGAAFRDLLPSSELAPSEPSAGHTAFELPSVPRVTVTRRDGTGAGELDVSTPLVNLAISTRVAFEVVWELANSSQMPELVRDAAAPTTPAPPG